jgi:hypothetical protein
MPIGNSESVRPKQNSVVIDLPDYRRKRLAARYRDTHAWDDGIPGHIAALLGCARTIEESVGTTQPSPENLAVLRYGFGLRRVRVEKAIDALSRASSATSGHIGLLNSIHELDTLLEEIHQVGCYENPVSICAAAQLARQVSEGLWLALFNVPCFPRQA